VNFSSLLVLCRSDRQEEKSAHETSHPRGKGYDGRAGLLFAMVANWRLGFGSVAVIVMATQPAHALEWELIQDIRDGAQAQVPVQEPALMQDSGDATRSKDTRTKNPGGNPGIHVEQIEDSKLSIGREEFHPGSSVRTAYQEQDPAQLETIKAGIEESGTLQGMQSFHGIHHANLVDNGSPETSKPHRSLGVDTGSHKLSAPELNVTIQDNASSGMISRKWELVTNTESKDNLDIAESLEIEASIAWELVPSGDEISANEIIDEMVDMKTTKLKAQQELIRAIKRRTGPGWLARLFSGKRNEPEKQEYMREDLLADEYDSSELAARVRVEAKELSSMLIEHLTPIDPDSQLNSDNLPEISQENHGSRVTSDLKMGINAIEKIDSTVGIAKDSVDSIKLDISSEARDLGIPTWNSTIISRVVPIIQIRF